MDSPLKVLYMIRTYNKDSGPSPWPSPEGEGMIHRAISELVISTCTT